MKWKSDIMNSLSGTYCGVSFELDLSNKLVMIFGDSGNGKSFLWQFLDSLRAEDKRIITYNYKDSSEDLFDDIKRFTGKLFVIDNADILLTDELRQYIAFDTNNQYIIIGRDPRYLMITKHNKRVIMFDKNKRVFKLTVRNGI